MDHRDDDPTKYLGPAHAYCNTSRGAAKGNRMRGRARRLPQVLKVRPAPRLREDDPGSGIFWGPPDENGQQRQWSRVWFPWRDPEAMERLRLEIESRKRPPA
ncbi:MAG TPA: hypothetical protein VIM33_08785 [Gaiellaceae bacterium]